MKHNQYGFGHILILILALVVGIIGLVGWQVVARSDKNTNSAKLETNSKQSTNTQASQQTDSADTPAKATIIVTPKAGPGLTGYASTTGKFRFKAPSTWVQPDNPEGCYQAVMLAPVKETLGKCASSQFGQLIVLSREGDIGKNYAYTSTSTSPVTQEDSQADGVKGKKYSRVSDDAMASVGEGVIPLGTKLVEYLFYANDRTYIVEYQQRSGWPDISAEVAALVRDTLRFSAN
jgi:hypothetical protein